LSETADRKLDISVIIPSYNSTDELHRCLHALANQKTTCHYEVIVVDSSDKPDEIDKLKTLPGEVRVVHLDGRTYPGVARNIGVQYARGKIIAFTDADCVVDRDWIENIYKSSKKNYNIIFGGSIRNGHPGNLIATAEYLMEFGEFLPERKSGETYLVPSCNMAMKKEVFLDVGGFSSLITSEDVLFCHMASQKGYRIYFVADMQITHFNRTDLEVMLHKQKELGLGASLLRFDYPVAGAFLIKLPVLSLLIPPIRIFTVVRKVLRIDLKYLPVLIKTFPYWFLGIIWFSYGFYCGHKVRNNRKVDY